MLQKVCESTISESKKNGLWHSINTVHSAGVMSLWCVELPHDDIIKWKHFLCYSPFVWGIHQSLVNSRHKGQWRRALMFSLIYAWINGWVNNLEAGDLRCHHTFYSVTVMFCHWLRRYYIHSPDSTEIGAVKKLSFWRHPLVPSLKLQFVHANNKENFKALHNWLIVRGIHSSLLDSLLKRPIMWKTFLCHDTINCTVWAYLRQRIVSSLAQVIAYHLETDNNLQWHNFQNSPKSLLDNNFFNILEYIPKSLVHFSPGLSLFTLLTLFHRYCNQLIKMHRFCKCLIQFWLQTSTWAYVQWIYLHFGQMIIKIHLQDPPVPPFIYRD